MRHLRHPLSTIGLLLSCAAATTFAQAAAPPWLTTLRQDAERLIKAATADDFAWRRLAELTDLHGARLSGSENLTRAAGNPDRISPFLS